MEGGQVTGNRHIFNAICVTNWKKILDRYLAYGDYIVVCLKKGFICNFVFMVCD